MDCKTKSFMTKKKAFTLVELLIVIAIIGILFIVLVSKVDFATDKAKTTGVQTDFRSFQMAFDTVAKENAGFNSFGWDIGDLNANGKRDSYDEGDTNKDGIQNNDEVWTGHKVPGETFTKAFTLIKPGTTFEIDGYDVDAIAKLETAINKNLDPKLHITIGTDGKITMANGAKDPWNKEYHGYYITNAEVDKKDQGAIVMYSDGVNNEFGSEHSIANGVVTIFIPGNNKAGKDDYSIVSVYTYFNGYGEVKNITTGFSNNQVMNVGNNNTGNGGNSGDVTEPDVVLSGGLYDSNNIQVASWEVLTTTYGLDVTKSYTSSTYLTDPASLYSVLFNNSALSTGTKLVVGSKNGDADVTQIGNYSLAGCENVIEIIIPNSVISISQNALQGCTNLTSLTVPFIGQNNSMNAYIGYWFGARSSSDSKDYIPQSLTNITITNATKIHSRAFFMCKNITNVFLNDGITSIDDAAFDRCSNLVEIVIPNSVTSIGREAFYSCFKLKRVIMSNNITSIGQGAFFQCFELSEITIPSTVTTVGEQAFYNCQALQTVNITDLNKWLSIDFKDNYSTPMNNASELLLNGQLITGEVVIPENLTKIPYCALKNTQISNVVLHNNITSIQGGAFSGCVGLTNINIPASITSIGGSAFANCTSLTNIVLNEGLKSIDNYSFSGCVGLTTLTIPNSVISMGSGMISGCNNLASLSVPFIGRTESSNTFLGYWFGETYASGNKDSVPQSLKTINITNTTTLGSNAFCLCSNITSISLNAGITSIGTYAFDRCWRLNTIVFMGSVEQWHAISKGTNWDYQIPATEIVCLDGNVSLR